jgi:protein-tyrosine-phosphatase
MHILFDCTGNICRSPTAERLAATYAAHSGIPNFTASSAGTRAVIGHPIHSDAAAVLEKLGADVSDFSASQLKSEIAAAADLIITMTRERCRPATTAPANAIERLARGNLRATALPPIAGQMNRRLGGDLRAWC